MRMLGKEVPFILPSGPQCEVHCSITPSQTQWPEPTDPVSQK